MHKINTKRPKSRRRRTKKSPAYALGERVGKEMGKSSTLLTSAAIGGAYVYKEKAIKRTAAKLFGGAVRAVGKVLKPIGLGAAAYTAYSVYNRTGDAAKAATAAGDELTFGAVSKVRDSNAASTMSRASISSSNASRKRKLARRSKARSVSGELEKGKSKTAAKPKTSKRKSATKAKRAGAYISVTRGGKTFKRKNPNFGKSRSK